MASPSKLRWDQSRCTRQFLDERDSNSLESEDETVSSQVRSGIPEVAPADADPVHMNKSLNEALEFILQYLDVPRLKICRLACKRWNEEVCFALRKRAGVNLLSNLPVWFFDMLSKCEENLPTPFQNIQIAVGNKKELDFANQCLAMEGMKITELHMNLNPHFRIPLETLHNFGAKDLKRLRIQCGTDKIIYTPSSNTATSDQFPDLESFQIDFSRAGRDLEMFAQQVINSAPKLEELRIWCRTDDVNPVLSMSSDGTGLDNLRLLEITLCKKLESQTLWDALDKLSSVKNLESLKLRFFYGRSSAEEMGRPQLMSFLEKFSHSLKNLTLYYDEILWDSPGLQATDEELHAVCPHLTSLDLKFLRTNNMHGVFPPQLKKLCAKHFEFDPNLPLVTPQCETVEEFRCLSCFNYNDGMSDLGLWIVAKKFPFARTWELGCCVLSDCARHIPKNLQVERLKIYPSTLESDYNCDMSEVLTGYKSEWFRQNSRQSVSIDEFRRSGCVLDFQGLKELYVAEFFHGCNYMIDFVIKYGIARIKNLEILGFHLPRKNLSTQTLVRYLQHLECIYVAGCCKPWATFDHLQQEDIMDLFIQMPNIHCDCRGDQTQFYEVLEHDASLQLDGY